MEKAVERGLDWGGLPVIATVARLLCRELTLQNEYLRLENLILKEKVSGRIRFTDEERRPLPALRVTSGAAGGCGESDDSAGSERPHRHLASCRAGRRHRH